MVDIFQHCINNSLTNRFWIIYRVIIKRFRFVFHKNNVAHSKINTRIKFRSGWAQLFRIDDVYPIEEQELTVRISLSDSFCIVNTYLLGYKHTHKNIFNIWRNGTSACNSSDTNTNWVFQVGIGTRPRFYFCVLNKS